MNNSALQAHLVLLRSALEEYWAEWALERNRPDAANGATMCRFTAAFLVLVLGDQWWVAGGGAHSEGESVGFFDGASWHGHYWVTDGELIVDLSAGQFGAGPIVLTDTDDKRYRENYSASELSDALTHVADRAQQWAEKYAARATSFTV